VSTLAERIDAALPQTQCTRCGYADCRAYAEALATGETDLNRCPPGGEAVIEALATLLQRPALALDPDCGAAELTPTVAWIREAECIGCYKCVAACPVDAIVGAPKHLHAVIERGCNGCELCLPACPVDCIDMRPASVGTPPARARADEWRRRYLARRQRLAERDARRERRRAALAREARIQRFLAAAHRRAEPSS
jgi:electron transport complex, RnfABCDGE type, B subunit